MEVNSLNSSKLPGRFLISERPGYEAIVLGELHRVPKNDFGLLSAILYYVCFYFGFLYKVGTAGNEGTT